MRIGYPCINHSIRCSGPRTFRLASWSESRHLTTVKNNLACLDRVLAWNADRSILFFRISSDLVPFASHPVCTSPWQSYFAAELADIGNRIAEAGIRISMHPDQFIVINAPDPGIVARSIAELAYHAELMDLMNLPASDKIQLHVGGVYGNPDESIARFVRVYRNLDSRIRRRLVVENDDRRFAAADCIRIHEETGIPVLFDVFHHSCNNRGEGVREMLGEIDKTWKVRDGPVLVDYSSQNPEKRPGGHAEHIDTRDFLRFLAITRPLDFDVMLEIKDKEVSALAAVAAAAGDPRFANRYGTKDRS